MTDSKIELLFGGIGTVYGGTRNAIKLDRPWQPDIVIDQSTCPFETSKQKEIARFDKDETWLVIENLHTPFPFHQLIIPQSCWSKEKVRSLGGCEKIFSALEIASSIVQAEDRELWLGIHVGPLAGQNIGHVHYHLLQPLDKLGSRETTRHPLSYFSASPLIFEAHSFLVLAGGVRAGQCFIVPQTGQIAFTREMAQRVATVLARIIALYSDKFRSKQGLPPDFVLGLKFLGGNILYGYYVPILNNWGFTEYFGLFEKTPLILPWSHQRSAEYLRE